jgi:hypothetical protein
LEASLQKLTHELRRSVTAQNIVSRHADLHAALSHQHFENRPTLIVDACFGFRLHPGPRLVRLNSGLIGIGIG